MALRKACTGGLRASHNQQQLLAPRLSSVNGVDTSRTQSSLMRPMQALYEKQGRSAQFASEAERDQSVRKELKALETSLQQQTKLASSCRHQVTDQAAACKAAAQVLFQPLPWPSQVAKVYAQVMPAVIRHGCSS